MSSIGVLEILLIFIVCSAVLAGLIVALVFILRGARKRRAAPPPAAAQAAPQPGRPYTPAAPVPPNARHVIRLSDVNDPSRSWTLGVTQGARVGRAETCQLILSDPSVSREQCKIMAMEDHIVVINQSHTNETTLNGRKIGTKPYALKVGDVLKFGRDILRVDEIQVPKNRRPEYLG